MADLAHQSSNLIPNSVYHLDGMGLLGPNPPNFHCRREMPEWPRIAVALGNQLHVVWFRARCRTCL